jgi:hypothetical protein
MYSYGKLMEIEKMLATEDGKEYTLNGQQYVACKAKRRLSCDGCDLLAKYCALCEPCPNVLRNGILYTCIGDGEHNDVIFVEINAKKNIEQ